MKWFYLEENISQMWTISQEFCSSTGQWYIQVINYVIDWQEVMERSTRMSGLTNSIPNLYLYSLPVQFTCTIYLYSLPVQFTCTVYLYILPVQFTCTVYLYSLPVQFTCTVYLYSLPPTVYLYIRRKTYDKAD